MREGVMVDSTIEENRTSVQQNVNQELSSAGQVTEFEEEQKTVHGDTQANKGREDISNEADDEVATEREDLEQEPLMEEIETANIDSSVGKENTETCNATVLSFVRTETTQEASPEIQMEEKSSGLEDSKSWNMNAEEAIGEANKQCEDIYEAKDTARHEISEDEVRESYRYAKKLAFLQESKCF